MLPLLPPMKTASGAGSPASAAGARPSVRYRLATAKFCAVLSDQGTSLRVTFHGTDPAGRSRQRHLNADTAGSRADIPQGYRPGRTASFASTAARTSCLVIGVLPRRKSFVRPARHPGRQRRAGFDQKHAQRCKFKVCEHFHGIGHKAFCGAAKVLTNGGLHMPPPGIGQRTAKGSRGLAASGQEKCGLSGAADRCRVTSAAVSANQLPVLPGAVQRCRQKLYAGYSRLHRIGQPCRVKGAAERRCP